MDREVFRAEHIEYYTYLRVSLAKASLALTRLLLSTGRTGNEEAIISRARKIKVEALNKLNTHHVDNMDLSNCSPLLIKEARLQVQLIYTWIKDIDNLIDQYNLQK